MSNEKLNRISSLSQVKLAGADSKKLEGARSQSKDVVSISGETSTRKKTNSLNESAQTIKFSHSLSQLTTRLRYLQSGEKDDPNYYTDTIAPIKLKGSTKKDIMGALNDTQLLPSNFIEDAGASIYKGKQALSKFKEAMAYTLDFDRPIYYDNVKEALAIVDKIEQLFKNNNDISKIIYIQSSIPAFENPDYHFLLGITKKNNLVGISHSHEISHS